MKRKKGNNRHWTRKKKKKTAKTTTTEAGRSLAVAELPPDVWWDILSRLPFKQVMLCRCICRAWNAHLSRIHHPPNPTTPTTILYYPYSRIHDYPIPLQNHLTLVELRNGASYESTVMRIEDRYTYLGGVGPDFDADPVLNFLCPVASCHGLVCFVRKIDRDSDSNIFVGNPLLKEPLLVVRPSKINMKTNGSQLSHVVGFGFSPTADRYKILRWFFDGQDKSHFLICTVGEGSRSSRGRGKRKVCLPPWRRLLKFPLHFGLHYCGLGSYLNAGIHWLASDSDEDNSVFISRLDLDTEQFGRVVAPQFNGTPLGNLSLGVSDGGHLIICANLRGQDVIDIWVMNQFNLWTKNLVVRSPITPNIMSPVKILNYGKVEAAAREGKVAEVMLFEGRSSLYACTTRGRHMRQLDRPLDGEFAIVHIPSLLSIKDVAKL